MRTKKPKLTPDLAPETPPEMATSPPADEDAKTSRFSFAITEDGKIDFNGMRNKTKEQLGEMLRDPTAQRELKFTPEQSATLEDVFGEDEANAVLDLFGTINSFAACRIYDVPLEITTQAFTFTPEHRRKLTPVYARLLNKWGPSFLKQYKDEIGAAVLTASVLNVQVQKMRVLNTTRLHNQRPTVVVRPQPEPRTQPEPPTVEVSDEPLA